MSSPVIRNGDEGSHGPPNVGLLTIQQPDAVASPRIFNLILLPVNLNEGSCIFSLFCFHYYYYYRRVYLTTLSVAKIVFRR
jgi:hypothetical protein